MMSTPQDVLVYKAILPFQRKGHDMIWMRLPVILLGLLVVAITQGTPIYSDTVGKKRQPASGISGDLMSKRLAVMAP